MRDKEYSLEKPSDTLRIALMGPSHVMGNGVADGETFESLVEERLNRGYRHGGYRRFEIMNFAVDGYTMSQQVALLEERALGLSPDIVIVTHYHRIRETTERYLQKVVWMDAAVPPGPLQTLLVRAGLNHIEKGRVPVPFAAARRLAGLAGVDTRMPSSESAARIRWIADDVIQAAFRRFAEVTSANHVQPLVLVLNAVIEDEPREVAHMDLIKALKLPVIDLTHIYSPSERVALRVAPWDEHPNSAGHRLIADRLYDRLVAFLESDAPAQHESSASTTPLGESYDHE
jgi:hypothetical protein